MFDVIEAICHDVRIPLTALLGYSAMIEEELGDEMSPAQQQYLRGINESVERVSRLLDELKRRLRPGAGEAATVPLPLDIAAYLDRARFSLLPLLVARSLRCEVEVQPGTPLVAADPIHLEQVLHNLLSNAIKFTACGGLIRLRAAADPVTGALLIEVFDTGVGISADALPLLFQRYYRVAEGGEPGSGLGLAICKELVEAMGGRIGVLSEPGRGSTFWFTLPILPLLPSARAEQPSWRPARP